MRNYNDWTVDEKLRYQNNLNSERQYGGIDFESASDMAIEMSVIPIEDFLTKVKVKFNELEHKDWNWSSFYNGTLEAYAIMIEGKPSPKESKQ